MARRKVIRSHRFVRRARRMAMRRITFRAFALAAFFGFLLFLASRPAFLIQEVIVSGASKEREEKITQYIREQLAGAYGGLFPKSSILFYPAREIERNIRAEFPQVSRVDIRLLSWRRLSVSVAERTPAALWCSPSLSVAGEECYFIDASGFAFEAAPGGASRLFYRISKEAESAPPLGNAVIAAKRLAPLLSFLDSLNALSLSPGRLALLSGGDIAAEIRGGAKIFARETENLAWQIENLRGLLSEKDLVHRAGEDLKVEYIDLRHGNKLYFKPR